MTLGKQEEICGQGWWVVGEGSLTSREGRKARRIQYTTPDLDDMATWVEEQYENDYQVIGDIAITWEREVVYVVNMVLGDSSVGDTGRPKGDG